MLSQRSDGGTGELSTMFRGVAAFVTFALVVIVVLAATSWQSSSHAQDGSMSIAGSVLTNAIEVGEPNSPAEVGQRECVAARTLVAGPRVTVRNESGVIVGTQLTSVPVVVSSTSQQVQCGYSFSFSLPDVAFFQFTVDAGQEIVMARPEVEAAMSSEGGFVLTPSVGMNP